MTAPGRARIEIRGWRERPGASAGEPGAAGRGKRDRPTNLAPKRTGVGRAVGIA